MTRPIVCPVCSSHTWTGVQKVLDSSVELVQSHWDDTNSPCPGSFQAANSEMDTWDPAEEAPALPSESDVKIQQLTEALDQLILDNLMGGM